MTQVTAALFDTVKRRDWLFIALGLVAVIAAFWLPSESFAKADVVGRAALSIFAATFFFFLNVRLPAISRKKRLKRVLLERYGEIKKDILLQIILASSSGASPEMVDELSDPVGFREHFRGDGSADSGWYAVLNGLNKYYVEQLALRLQLLKTEVETYVVMVDIEDEELLKFMKQLSAFAQLMIYTGSDYESQKTWGKFLYSLFSNWDPAVGQLSEDPTLVMLRKL